MRAGRTWLPGRIALAAMLVIVASAAPAGARTIGEIVDDARIAAEIKAKLTADKLSNLTKIDVKSDTGVVTLGGTVDSMERRDRAAQIAAAVTGVKGVVNNLQVKGAPSAAAPPASGPPPAGPPPTVGGQLSAIDATGTVQSVDAASGTITLTDGRVIRATDRTTVWQPTTVGQLAPGTDVLIRGVAPAGFQSGATGQGSDWMMGTVWRVDPGRNQITLTDGTLVRAAPATVISGNGQRLALSQLQPGSEVAIRARASYYGTSGDGNALPQPSATAATIDASEIQALWTPPS